MLFSSLSPWIIIIKLIIKTWQHFYRGWVLILAYSCVEHAAWWLLMQFRSCGIPSVCWWRRTLQPTLLIFLRVVSQFLYVLSSLFLLHHSSIYLVVIPAITSSHRTTTVHSSTTISWSDAFAHTYLILSSLFFFYHFFLASKLKYKAWRPVSQIAKMAELLR